MEAAAVVSLAGTVWERVLAVRPNRSDVPSRYRNLARFSSRPTDIGDVSRTVRMHATGGEVMLDHRPHPSRVPSPVQSTLTPKYKSPARETVPAPTVVSPDGVSEGATLPPDGSSEAGPRSPRSPESVEEAHSKVELPGTERDWTAPTA